MPSGPRPQRLPRRQRPLCSGAQQWFAVGEAAALRDLDRWLVAGQRGWPACVEIEAMAVLALIALPMALPADEAAAFSAGYRSGWAGYTSEDRPIVRALYRNEEH